MFWERTKPPLVSGLVWGILFGLMEVGSYVESKKYRVEVPGWAFAIGFGVVGTFTYSFDIPSGREKIRVMKYRGKKVD
jgi:hypothetical protein